METSTEICLIAQCLAKIKTSAHSITDLNSFLDLLNQILSDLASHPFDGKYQILKKDSYFFFNSFMKTQAAQELLTTLGYNEESDQYVYAFSDENLMKIERCRDLLQNSYNNSEETLSLNEIPNENMLDELTKGLAPKQTKSLPNLGHHSESKEERFGNIKNILLLKQMKKEQSSEMFNSFNVIANHARRSPQAEFNSNGYFYQSCSTRNSRKSRCCIKELFHKQDTCREWRSANLM